MVSSYTPRGRITKQGDNDNPNSWGAVLNDQVIDLIDAQIDGVAQVDVTGSSTVTLTTSNGADDQARNKVIEFTGVLGANIDVIIPAAEKVYFFRGAHTGGDITVKIGASATSVLVKPGYRKLIYSNGLDVYDMIDLSAYTLSGSLGDLALLDTVGSAQIDAGAITTAKIADGAVTSAKLDPSMKFALIGEVRTIAHATLPTGWLFCYGQAVSRTTYAELFASIGTTFGAGDGSTTFNIPDTRGRTKVGKDNMGGTAANRITAAGSGIAGTTLGAVGGTETHTLTEAQIPAHNHFVFNGGETSATSGTYLAFKGNFGNTNNYMTAFYDAAVPVYGKTSDAGSGQSHNNTQPSIVFNDIIFANV